MKLILLSLLTPFLLHSQEKFYGIMPMEDGRIVYNRIVNADSLTRDQIFSTIKDWAVNSYGSQKQALQTEDKEAGYIAYKGFIVVQAYTVKGINKGSEYNEMLYHTLKFYIKDGKFKMVFDDLYTYSPLTEALLGSADKIPLERWGKDKKNNTPTKFIEAYTKDIVSMDKTINKLLDNILDKVNKDKSAFDF